MLTVENRATGATEEPRYISFVLMAGLIALPLIFVWLLLRRGYGRSTRIAAFSYAFMGPLLNLVAWMLTGEWVSE
ncbi:hypothetical protein [Iodidimonas sp. SYSU 1G8]|uniref:hypothetical protein n=1 Tax=Iodidimonas sp. SYSU 1G8 TaxID=3133967 RepID=UPI0031FF1071